MNYAFILLGKYFRDVDAEMFFRSLLKASVEMNSNNKIYLQMNAYLNKDKLDKELREKEIGTIVIETFDNNARNRTGRRDAMCNLLSIITHIPKRIIFIPKQEKVFIDIVKEWEGCEVCTFNPAVDNELRKLKL